MVMMRRRSVIKGTAVVSRASGLLYWIEAVSIVMRRAMRLVRFEVGNGGVDGMFDSVGCSSLGRSRFKRAFIR